jgi:archaellum component FlaF (FlaF/FlaG flagellin family)
MGFATSITVAIIFLAIIIISTVTLPIIMQSYEKVQESKDDKHKIQMDQLGTAIDITNIVKSGSNSLIITVTNKGTAVLRGNKSNVLIDGIYKTYTVTPTGYWMPQKDAVFIVNASTSANHIITITSENVISDIDTFYS